MGCKKAPRRSRGTLGRRFKGEWVGRAEVLQNLNCVLSAQAFDLVEEHARSELDAARHLQHVDDRTTFKRLRLALELARERVVVLAQRDVIRAEFVWVAIERVRTDEGLIGAKPQMRPRGEVGELGAFAHAPPWS